MGDNQQLESIRSELRKIRDGVEVFAVLAIWLTGMVVFFSGWLFDRLVGWPAALAIAGTIIFSVWIAAGIRNR